ncbi:low molecular weight phosphatase family protein [Streptomyces sp. NPDC005181]|uniref:arsenate reductase/protein-tyrosine-phosphatase family protein n=1 Tax=Streptomyces sp. NPDC005181 TaxID=3156869 RepID=UPI0033B68B13
MAEDATARLRVLFVCTGNMHRSPLAERLLAPRLPGAQVTSAGTQAPNGQGMHPATLSVLTELGGDGSGFVTRPLTARLVADASLVLGMEREHRESAARLCPTALRRCFTVKEFVRLAHRNRPDAPPREVIAAAAAARGSHGPVRAADDTFPDPWGEDYDMLQRQALEIDRCVAEVADLLRGRSRIPAG